MLEPSFKTKAEKETEKYGKFIIEPLPEGFGHTLGNTLRRILLTALDGAAISAVKMTGVKHQFSTITGVKEDVVELALNLKKVRLKIEGDEAVTLNLSVRGPKKVLASDIETPAGVEIINKDLVLASLSDKKAKLEVKIQAKKGYGYVFAEEQEKKELGLIPLDCLFTPIQRVNYRVEATRVGRMINLDKVILEIWSDGTILPSEALERAAQVAALYFKQIYEPREIPEEEKGTRTSSLPPEDLSKITIEELELPTRVTNALKVGNIKTVKDLINTPASKLAKIRNLGSKSITLIEQKLNERKKALDKK